MIQSAEARLKQIETIIADHERVLCVPDLAQIKLIWRIARGEMSMADDPHGSLGAFRVRESFNPSKDDVVDKLKRYTADLIDIVEAIKHLDPRLAALAQTSYEEACMWAVKLATTKKP